MGSESQSRASIKWNKSRDNIVIRPDKEFGAEIRKAAAERGQTIQVYVLEAVKFFMDFGKDVSECQSES